MKYIEIQGALVNLERIVVIHQLCPQEVFYPVKQFLNYRIVVGYSGGEDAIHVFEFKNKIERDIEFTRIRTAAGLGEKS